MTVFNRGYVDGIMITYAHSARTYHFAARAPTPWGYFTSRYRPIPRMAWLVAQRNRHRYGIAGCQAIMNALASYRRVCGLKYEAYRAALNKQHMLLAISAKHHMNDEGIREKKTW